MFKPPMQAQSSRVFTLLMVAITFLVVVAGVIPLDAHAQDIRPGPEEDLNAEAELAERYAPVLYLKRQRYACDPSGEPYVPLPVEAVLDDPSVLLRLDTGGRTAASDQIVTTGPSMGDLGWLGPGYYVDFPGNPIQPRCLYEQWSRSKIQEHEPTVYARITTEEGVPGLTLQYWFFWAFNDFNNRHEGDWELVQLTFEASTVQEALQQEPASVVYAQHGGGERTSWDSDTLRREGSHPVVYAAAGSHASYYADHLYLGWGEGGTGFGCDDTTGPHRRIALEMVLIPQRPDADSKFAWLFFRGRWGEKQPWEFNGPTGPQRGRRWYRPVSWINELRDRSLYVPESFSLGPAPGSVFCTVTEQAAKGLMFFTLHPWRMATALIVLFGTSVYLFFSRRGSLVRAAWLYLRYWGSFSSIGLVYIPLGLAAVAFQQLVASVPPGKWLVELLGRSDEGRLAASLLLGSVQSVLEAILIGPAVIAVIQMIRAGEPTDTRSGLRRARAHIPELGRAWIRVQSLILLRAMTVVGIPFALRDLVRWRFWGHAVMIDGAATPRGTSSTSAAAVSGTWWRTAMEVLLFSAIGLLPGPFVGILLITTVSSSIEFVHALSSVIYAVAVPYKWIGLTLLYLDRTGRPMGADIPDRREAFWREIRERLHFHRERERYA